jgi:hypothetical protein
MTIQTHCDWCAENLHEKDHAEMCVTIQRLGSSPVLERRWAEEVRATRHFCVTPKRTTTAWLWPTPTSRVWTREAVTPAR